ncbi:MAG TPA: hypothetical protein VEB00_00730 [Clostridia bacterium]|nr:hypothetical protein [Clostridia bacterium]
MADKELLAEEKQESIIKDLSRDSAEGCINCEFNEYRDGISNFCSEHERYVKDYDPPCKAYVEQGSY